MKIDSSKLQVTVSQILNEYSEEVKDEMRGAINDVAESGKEELKATSPKRTGRYAKSWNVRKKDGSNFVNRTIHNKKYYQLTHLLEFGHATRNGGKTRAFPHIKPVEIKCQEEAERRVKSAISKIK